MENKKISVILNGKSIFADSGLSLSEIISGEKPCGGHGRCGKCKIIARGDNLQRLPGQKIFCTCGKAAFHNLHRENIFFHCNLPLLLFSLSRGESNLDSLSADFL